MPAAPKPTEITSQVTVDRDVYPELHAILLAKPKNQRAEFLRALAAEAVSSRGVRRPARREASGLAYEDGPGNGHHAAPLPPAPAPAPARAAASSSAQRGAGPEQQLQSEPRRPPAQPVHESHDAGASRMQATHSDNAVADLPFATLTGRAN